MQGFIKGIQPKVPSHLCLALSCLGLVLPWSCLALVVSYRVLVLPCLALVLLLVLPFLDLVLPWPCLVLSCLILPCVALSWSRSCLDFVLSRHSPCVDGNGYATSFGSVLNLRSIPGKEGRKEGRSKGNCFALGG
jgi:hypothetical protein